MKNRNAIIVIGTIGLLLVLMIAAVGIIAVKGLGISTGRYLEAVNGASMIVIDNSPIQMSNRTNKTKAELFDEFDVGDEILIIHDGIAETYPGKTGVYVAFKLSEGTSEEVPLTVVKELTELGWLLNGLQPDGTLPGDAFEVSVSYANWAEKEQVFFGALNKEKMAISSVAHLPIYKFDTLEDLEQFKHAFDGVLAIAHDYNEIQSLNNATAKYDTLFFEENTLMLVYVGASSGTYRFGVNSVFCEGKYFCIHVEQINNPEVFNEEMAGWYLTVVVPDSMISNCTEYDADLNNFEN